MTLGSKRLCRIELEPQQSRRFAPLAPSVCYLIVIDQSRLVTFYFVGSQITNLISVAMQSKRSTAITAATPIALEQSTDQSWSQAR